MLGIDTATTATAVALRLPDGDTREGRDDPNTRSASGAAGAHPGHATRLLPLAAELLATAGLSWNAVERIAVGVGPGTFTGLRVGIATARGLAQALACPLIGVSSLEALAAPALEEVGAVLAVIDARRGEVFAAAYESASGLVAGPKALAPEAVGAFAGAGWLAVGDGAVRYREEIGVAGLHVPPQDSPLHVVRAASVCAIAAARTPTSGARVAPDYLRRPDAELALEGAEKA